MARVEIPIFRHPMESLGHALHDTPAWLGRHWKSLTLALAAIGGGAIAVSQLARPYTPDTQARNTTPTSDPVKPPEEKVGIVVVDNSPAQPAPVVAKNVVEQPVISPLEQAIRTGRIEMGNLPTNSIKPLSPDEARGRLEQTKGKLILPFDLKVVPNLVLETVIYKVPRGEAKALGMNNIPKGTKFPSFVDGEAMLLPNVTTGGTKSIAIELKSGGNTFGILTLKEGAESPLTPNKPTPVKIGDELFTIGTEEALGFYSGRQQVIIKLNQGDPNTWDATVSDLLLAETQLAYLTINQ